MSHYTKVKTKITSKSLLMKALNDMGFTSEMIRDCSTAEQLEGYGGDKRADRAEIILPRKHVGGASNDIGFKLQEDGTYGAIISEYDSRSNPACRKNERTKGILSYNSDWLNLLNQRYAYHHLKQQVVDNDYYITSEREVNGEVFLEVERTYQ